MKITYQYWFIQCHKDVNDRGNQMWSKWELYYFHCFSVNLKLS